MLSLAHASAAWTRGVEAVRFGRLFLLLCLHADVCDEKHRRHEAAQMGQNWAMHAGKLARRRVAGSGFVEWPLLDHQSAPRHLARMDCLPARSKAPSDWLQT